jgi:hypothetical protein
MVTCVGAEPPHTFIRAQRASVGSTDAAKDVVARFGRIDRSIGRREDDVSAIAISPESS